MDKFSPETGRRLRGFRVPGDGSFAARVTVGGVGRTRSLPDQSMESPLSVNQRKHFSEAASRDSDHIVGRGACGISSPAAWR